MPNLTTHYICGKIIKDKLKIKNPLYLTGCILPDYTNNSHYKKQVGQRLIPDIELFLKTNTIQDEYLFLGYLTHLLLDKYYIEDFVLNNIYKRIPITENIFTKDKIYTEYTLISTISLNKYNLTIDKLKKTLINNEFTINYEKFNHDISEIETTKHNNNMNLKYINLDDFFTFIETSCNKITNNLKHYHKIFIRNKIKKIRNAMSSIEVKQKSSLIKENLNTCLKYLTYNNILIYKNFNNEVCTNEIINELIDKNINIYLPKINNDEMLAIPYTKQTKLKQNQLKIEEPIGSPENIDKFICITPLIAVDLKGNRIGFGKGYYDKFLKNKTCIKIGLAYSYQIINKIYNEPQDISLDYIITEKEVFKLN